MKRVPNLVKMMDAIIGSTLISSPLGDLLACTTARGICVLDFIDKFAEPLEAFHEDDERFQLLRDELEAYFLGNLKEFSVPLDLIGTDFQVLVWKALLAIPYGKTWSYLQQSIYMNYEKAIRAVASANGRNPISIIVPCHRVIGSDGKLTGYAGGLHRKQWLLDLEQGSAQIFPLL